MESICWIKDIDGALFVAVLSLLFTGVVSFITIRYTKRSLIIAKRSLMASQISIDTSIELYEKQKNDRKDLDEKMDKHQFQKTVILVKSPLIIFDSVYKEMYGLLSEILKDKSKFENLNKYIDIIKTEIGHEVIVKNTEGGDNNHFHIDSIDYNVGLFTDTCYKNANCMNEYLLKKCTYLSYLISYGSKFTIDYFISVLSEKSEQRINKLFNEETINFFLEDIERVISLTDEIYFDFTGENIKLPHMI